MDEITHIGVVKSVDPTGIVVEIVSGAACGSCAAAGLCATAEAVKKDVTVPFAEGYVPGERVEVALRESMGIKAVVLSYVAPLFILLILCVSLSAFMPNELLVGAIGLGGVAVYYAALYLFRWRIGKEYTFQIRPLRPASMVETLGNE